MFKFISELKKIALIVLEMVKIIKKSMKSISKMHNNEI